MTKQPDPLDVQIGAIVRQRRMMLGISQEKLGDALGITFQQVQKYEKGTNRISGSRMVGIAKALSCRVADLFPDYDATPVPTAGFDSVDFRIAKEAGALTTAAKTSVLAVIRALSEVARAS